ncbi:unnamed protein product, partial [Polarella glacialis]
ELGIRTVFNILGPLTNPARPDAMVCGVYTPVLGRLFVEVFKMLGMSRALVVHGCEGLDELSIEGASKVWELHQSGEITEYEVRPSDFGLDAHPLSEVAGGTPEENAAEMRELLSGRGRTAVRDMIVMNASAALYAAGKVADFKSGCVAARAALADGRAIQTLDAYISASNNPKVRFMKAVRFLSMCDILPMHVKCVAVSKVGTQFWAQLFLICSHSPELHEPEDALATHMQYLVELALPVGLFACLSWQRMSSGQLCAALHAAARLDVVPPPAATHEGPAALLQLPGATRARGSQLCILASSLALLLHTAQTLCWSEAALRAWPVLVGRAASAALAPWDGEELPTNGEDRRDTSHVPHLMFHLHAWPYCHQLQGVCTAARRLQICTS